MLKELKINPETCIHCGICRDVCFTDVIRWDEDKKIPYGKYPQDCQLCCICEAACPKHAIEVIPDWKKKYYPDCLSAGGREKASNICR